MSSEQIERFFDCPCGNKFNRLVPRDTSGLQPTARPGVSRVVIGATRKEKTVCPACGEMVECSYLNPEGLPPKLLFNFLSMD